MKRLKKKVKFLEGQAALEYVILIASAVVIAALVIALLGGMAVKEKELIKEEVVPEIEELEALVVRVLLSSEKVEVIKELNEGESFTFFVDLTGDDFPDQPVEFTCFIEIIDEVNEVVQLDFRSKDGIYVVNDVVLSFGGLPHGIKLDGDDIIDVFMRVELGSVNISASAPKYEQDPVTGEYTYYSAFNILSDEPVTMTVEDQPTGDILHDTWLGLQTLITGGPVTFDVLVPLDTPVSFKVTSTTDPRVSTITSWEAALPEGVVSEVVHVPVEHVPVEVVPVFTCATPLSAGVMAEVSACTSLYPENQYAIFDVSGAFVTCSESPTPAEGELACYIPELTVEHVAVEHVAVEAIPFEYALGITPTYTGTAADAVATMPATDLTTVDTLLPAEITEPVGVTDPVTAIADPTLTTGDAVVDSTATVTDPFTAIADPLLGGFWGAVG